MSKRARAVKLAIAGGLVSLVFAAVFLGLTRSPFATRNTAPSLTVNFTELPRTHRADGYNALAYIYIQDTRLEFILADGVNHNTAEQTIQRIAWVFYKASTTFPDVNMSPMALTNRRREIDARHLRIDQDISAEYFDGLAVYLFFSQPRAWAPPTGARQITSMDAHTPLLAWLSIGIEDYLMESGIPNYLPADELVQWLVENTVYPNPPFGDAWFIPAFIRATGPNQARDAAYTLVRRWSEGGTLHDAVKQAMDNCLQFFEDTAAYLDALTGGQLGIPAVHYRYHFGDFEIWTAQARYFFHGNVGSWQWRWVKEALEYMDAATFYARELIQIDHDNRITVDLHPSVIDMGVLFYHFPHFQEWKERYRLVSTALGFPNLVILAPAATNLHFFTHEAIHAFALSINYDIWAPTWLEEGLAVFGEAIIRENFEGNLPYTPWRGRQLSHLHNMARTRGGGLTLLSHTYMYGRTGWRYEDAGSLVLFMYNQYGIDAVIEYYRRIIPGQDSAIAEEVFGKPLGEIILNWRAYLWPDGEPEGWWAGRAN